MSSARESELHLLAFRYVSGELTGDEASAFEDRLGRDQTAREAVAGAVELIGALGQITPEPSHVSTTLPLRRRAVRLAPLACGAAAAAALAFLIGRPLLFPSHPENAPDATSPSPTSDKVARSPTILETSPLETDAAIALTWSGIRREPDPQWLDQLDAWSEIGESPVAPEPERGMEIELVTEPPVSSWMMEVASLDLPSPPEAPETQEN